MAVAEFIGELASTILIPNRIGMQLRDILLYQSRLRKTPGKRPLSFISRPSFAAALDYLRFSGTLDGESGELCRWWEKFVRDNQSRPVLAPAEEDGERPAPRRRRKRKRRSPKKGGDRPAQTPAP
jgi:poly(A) polymerase